MCDDCHAEEQIAWEQQREPKQRHGEHKQRESNKIFYNRHIKGQPCEYTCEECYDEEQAEWAKQAEAAGQPYIFYDGVPRQEPWMSALN
jgi:DNA-directed RNA polymerase subunit M/transcription elongation factor TFIIS